MPVKTIRKTERDEAVAKLREWLKPGDTVYTVLRHVSASGMQREIGVVIMRKGVDLHPNYAISQALGYRIGKRDGLVVGGCGSDMGFEVVYNLGRALWPEGFKLAKGQYGRNGDKSGFDRDGGYALKHRWL